MGLYKNFHAAAIILFFFSNAFAHTWEPNFNTFKLQSEPLVRIGLVTNSSYAMISTRDGSLAASIAGENPRFLDTTSVRVSSSSYSPPTFKIYHVQIPDVENQDLVKNITESINSKLKTHTTIISQDDGSLLIRLNLDLYDKAEAETYVQRLEEIDIENGQIAEETHSDPSDDAIALTQQIASNPKSKVRSLTLNPSQNGLRIPGFVRNISSSRAAPGRNRGAYVNPSIRNVVVSGRGANASFQTLRPVVIGSANPRGIIYLNGKRYRGKMEVFVNSKGRITVVNVVPMEDYLLGVVPAELSLPQLEAQKAQAVAARTYAFANKNGYGNEGFDMLPTVWSQVYKGVGRETNMGSRAVRETRGVVATYSGKPINALYTSTCGGRTEDSGNIFEFSEPYLRGVNCALDGKLHFAPFLVKSSREPALIRNEANYALVRLASEMAVNNHLVMTTRFDDEYFEDPPNPAELKSWLNQFAAKLGKPFPFVNEETTKPLKLARVLHSLIYAPGEEADADTLMSESDVNYHLSFLDAGEVPRQDRVMLAEMLRDGWFSIYPDLTIKPKKDYSRGKILRLLRHIYEKKKLSFSFEEGTANPTEDSKLIIKIGRSDKEITVNPNVFLFRKFGDEFYQVKEAALVGGEKVRYKLNALGEAIYLEIEPTDKTTVAEKMSPFTNWRAAMSASTLRARLARYVKGMGALIDVRIKTKGFSRRATELEIITTNGRHSLKGGKIRSALRLREQLFVMDKRMGSNGRIISATFTGRGWGHGVGMCQYGAYGFAKMGLKYDQIIKHYYTGVALTKVY